MFFTILQTIIVFVILLAVLVIAHEFGHFIVAKKSGMQVDEFGFGFPPRIFGIKHGETTYSLNWIPLGGFVRIVGEDGTDGSNPRSFVNKNFWPRFATLVAGVTMNVILAWLIITVCLLVGLPTEVVPGQQLPKYASVGVESIAITAVEPGTPAATAGLQAGDQVKAINGTAIADVNSLAAYTASHQGQTLQFSIERGRQLLTVPAFARVNPTDGNGSVGIAVSEVGKLRYTWYVAPYVAVGFTGQIVSSEFSGLWALVHSRAALSEVGGPVKIAQLTGQVIALGFVYLLQFAAFLSINLAIINILPFPALDGGRVLFLVIEKVRGVRNNERVEQWANTIGFALLLLLVAAISVHDVIGLFHH
jgi:regulator of sigma E protease